MAISACTKMDDGYKEFLEGGEISYTGKIDSLKVYSGKNRVKVEGLFMSDPKITECRVFWNNGEDFVSVPVNRTNGVDTLEVIIDNLEENIYSFDVRTYDALGNESVSVSGIGSVYGERYQNSLYSRPVYSNVLVGNELEVKLGDMDLSSGVIGSEIVYTNQSDEESKIFVPIDSFTQKIPDFKAGSIYSFSTLFLPDETSIDTFYTTPIEYKPVPTPVLGNAAIPFKAESTSGRWGVLAAPWISNDAVKNHNGYGGWDEWNGNIFNIESGWGAAPVINGKIYQVVAAEPATYQLKVVIRDTNHDATADRGAYFMIAQGDGLPDFVNVETAPEVLGYKRILSTSSLEYLITFTVDAPTNISVGQVTTQPEGFNRYCNIRSWEIIVVN
ncbi:DUF5013 domain-containing protein [Aestuariibaculum sp. TT11]|uniref:DUF5013 domain-containing protein n=1 Tax=Aestuariibaculum sediminum TaxID=2770637 RepID=A0A8J6Q7A4_9FLAO|nr:DUF5013 domain-containing protein [Aestuariibaculum sediminum]